MRNGDLRRGLILLVISAFLGLIGFAAAWGWNSTQSRLDAHEVRLTSIEKIVAEGAMDRRWIRESLQRIEGMMKEKGR